MPVRGHPRGKVCREDGRRDMTGEPSVPTVRGEGRGDGRRTDA